MKRLLFIITLLLVSLPCMAKDITLQWDTMPAGQAWDNVRIYEVIPGGTGTVTKVAEVLGTETTATIQNVSIGDHIYIARSVQSGNESGNSNPATAEINPSEPQNFRIIAVNIDAEGNVTFRLVDPAEFFRG